MTDPPRQTPQQQADVLLYLDQQRRAAAREARRAEANFYAQLAVSTSYRGA